MSDGLIPAMKVIYLTNEPTLVLGSSFQSDIYYQYKNQVSPSMGLFFYEHHEFFYKDLCSDEVKNIKYGEVINIYGLRIMYLKSVLLLDIKEGDLRIAYRDRRG